MADEPNEILAAVADAKARETGAAERDQPATRNRWPMRIISVGIGSAAIAAAVLYANSGRKKN